MGTIDASLEGPRAIKVVTGEYWERSRLSEADDRTLLSEYLVPTNFGQVCMQMRLGRPACFWVLGTHT